MKDKKPELKIGKTYSIELYPRKDKSESRYLGKLRGEHIFFDDNGRGGFIFVNESWIIEKEGVITHDSKSPLLVRCSLAEVVDFATINTGKHGEI